MAGLVVRRRVQVLGLCVSLAVSAPLGSVEAGSPAMLALSPTTVGSVLVEGPGDRVVADPGFPMSNGWTVRPPLPISVFDPLFDAESEGCWPDPVSPSGRWCGQTVDRPVRV